MSDKEQHILAKRGLAATWIYLIILIGGVPLLGTLGAIEIKPISLNELGDLLAGAFGPLAIFWIVLGFFQQGRELQNSVATLELQAKELANSVTQQKELVSVTRETLEQERQVLSLKENQRKKALQPTLQISFQNGGSYGQNSFVHDLRIVNTGESVSNFSANLVSGTEKICSISAVHFKNDGALDSRHYGKIEKFDGILDLVIEYTDRDGEITGQLYGIEYVEQSDRAKYVITLRET
ncbi:hypothetical protein SAMN04488040_0175 [Sulfitobacter marinus]|uniref:Uncharacterized protein n=1 Tax=Sulfitobacter marinus TaxID=394264 RepID=A0A1I6PI52_9RHOB|nr:hypothetical protein [Sulfitobacter marinus]SFS39877.1 hypothetical protein SAMN04488040_0175 [Sulfitobacter marinus]